MAVWVACNKSGNIPDNAVRAGYEADGRPLYVAQAKMEDGVMTPGKVGINHWGASIPWGGKEIIVEKYDVLVQPVEAEGFYEWKRQSGGQIPYQAVPTAKQIYVARCFHDGSLVPGKVDTDKGYVYVCYEMKERRYNDYEVLCHIK